MPDLSPALIEELAKALYAAAHQVEVSDLEPHDVQFAGEQLAPILSRALAEAAHDGAEKMRDDILNQIRSIPCWNNGQTSEFDIEDQSHRLTVLDDIKWVPNPCLTEKEKSNDGH